MPSTPSPGSRPNRAADLIHSTGCRTTGTTTPADVWRARAATLRLSTISDIVRRSGQYGKYDLQFSYAIVGADVSFRSGRTDLRFEYLARRQQFDTSNPDAYRYEIPSKGGDFFVKHGAYIELKQPLTQWLDLIGRVDGMYREGNVLVESPLSQKSTVLRYTVGTMFTIK